MKAVVYIPDSEPMLLRDARIALDGKSVSAAFVDYLREIIHNQNTSGVSINSKAKFIKVTNAFNEKDGIARVNPEHIKGYSIENIGCDNKGFTYITTGDTSGHWVKETPDEIDKLIAEA